MVAFIEVVGPSQNFVHFLEKLFEFSDLLVFLFQRITQWVKLFAVFVKKELADKI
jgi:hypothetical protein